MFKLVAAAVLAAALLSVAQADARNRAASPAGTRWVEIHLDEIAAHRTNPPRAARGLALLSVAVNNASRLPREYRSAAVAGSASTVLAYLYPDRRMPSRRLLGGSARGSRSSLAA